MLARRTCHRSRHVSSQAQDFFLVVFSRTVISLPYHAFQNIIDDEVTLNNDKQQGHVGPAKLAKLELVLTLLQISHKEHEPYI